ncbi:unnamed protein product [Closterium sp. NIES-54]
MMRKVVRRAEWEARMDAAAVRAEDMNKLVMNYLVTEGYVDAARKFEIESGTDRESRGADAATMRAGADLGAVAERMAVKQAVQRGDVEDAIDRVNDLNPEAAYLEELERTVALLAFEDPATSAPATLAELLDVSQRDKAAAELNAAILASQGHEKDPKLPSVLRMLLWLQGQLDGRVAYPKVTDLTTALLHDPPSL